MNEVEKKLQEIKGSIKSFGCDDPSYHSILNHITKLLAKTNDEKEIYLLLQVLKQSILEDKEKEFNKHMKNTKYFLFRG